MTLTELGISAKAAFKVSSRLRPETRKKILLRCAEALLNNEDNILSENAKDVQSLDSNTTKAFIDRLTLNHKRIADMADGLRQIADLKDPVGEIMGMNKLPNGLMVGQKRVPLGVIGIIFEARPNVSADAFGLCFKTGNTVILRGGKEAVLSNKAITEVFRRVMEEEGIDKNIVQLVTDTSRETATAMMRLNQYIDVLIPRGGDSLIKTVVENSTIPVIETGTGNCHIFVDESADLDKALEIIINAKVQRPGVCNSCEKVLLHKNLRHFLPRLCNELSAHGVQIRGDEAVCHDFPNATPATEEDWSIEYLDLIIGIRLVDGIDEAIANIERYSSGHSEAILTESYANSQKFLDEVDSAAVYVNASTRFTDGNEFGFGAEIGISTQKLHARGPMGLKELTSYKYIIYGNGQIRP